MGSGLTHGIQAYCTVDPALWQEMQTKLQNFREEQARFDASFGEISVKSLVFG